MLTGLSRIKGLKTIPNEVNFLLVKSEISSGRLQQELLEKYRILIRDCSTFETLGDRYFRVADRTIPENNKLLQGLSDIFNK